MAYLAIAYPKIKESDYDWIQSIRKMHDQRYFDVVRPHVTLVFGTNKLKLEDFATHISSKLAKVKAFAIDLDSAKLIEDDSKKFFHVFLIPSEGRDQINKIHDLLYEDELQSELRLDIPFMPHLGIGTGDKKEMSALEKVINKNGVSIKGQIETVSIVEYDGNKVVDCIGVSLS